MADKAEALDAFVDMVDGPVETPEELQDIADDIKETEALPDGDETEVEPVVEGEEAEGEVTAEDGPELFEVQFGDLVYEVPEDLKKADTEGALGVIQTVRLNEVSLRPKSGQSQRD